MLPQYKISLASTSPRRFELLRRMGFTHIKTVSTDFDEKSLNKAEYPNVEAFVKACATGKAQHAKADAESQIIIAADTVVEFKGKILEKPENPQHAKELLSQLSGETHTVWSGVAIRDLRNNNLVVFAEQTQVVLDDLTDDIIDKYVSTGDPLDKAGGYGIQSQGCILAKGVHGCFYNVIGLPVNRLANQLRALPGGPGGPGGLGS